MSVLPERPRRWQHPEPPRDAARVDRDGARRAPSRVAPAARHPEGLRRPGELGGGGGERRWRAAPARVRGRQSQKEWPTRRRQGQQQRRLRVVCSGRRGDGTRVRCARARAQSRSLACRGNGRSYPLLLSASLCGCRHPFSPFFDAALPLTSRTDIMYGFVDRAPVLH